MRSGRFRLGRTSRKQPAGGRAVGGGRWVPGRGVGPREEEAVDLRRTAAARPVIGGTESRDTPGGWMGGLVGCRARHVYTTRMYDGSGGSSRKRHRRRL